MKRILSLIIATILCYSLVACSGGENDLMDDEDLKSQLQSAIQKNEMNDSDLQAKLLAARLFKMKVCAIGLPMPEIKSIEKTDDSGYCAIGELFIRWKDKQTDEFSDEYIPFTAYFSTNENGEISCYDMVLEIPTDSILSD